jgi:lysozyme
MNIQIGSNGPDVTLVQALLHNRGYSAVNADGDFGGITSAAVKDFQSKHGLTPDGIVTDDLVSMLRGTTGAPTFLGVDVSHYQAAANWSSIAAAGISFAYIKTTEGVAFKDPCADKHATNAKAAGVKIGYYHFANVDQDATAEAKFFSACLQAMPQADLLPVLDIETNKSNLTALQIQQWITLFINEMKQEGHDIMIYSYTPFIEQYLPPVHPFGSVPLWLAQYRPVDYPKMPHGWTSYTVWQYTNAGNVGGVTFDMNKCSKLPLINQDAA